MGLLTCSPRVSSKSCREGLKIPLNLPLQRETFNSPLWTKGARLPGCGQGRGDFRTNGNCENQFTTVKLTLTLPCLLTGSAGLDWFFFNPANDKITDWHPMEIVTSTDSLVVAFGRKKNGGLLLI